MEQEGITANNLSELSHGLKNEGYRSVKSAKIYIRSMYNCAFVTKEQDEPAGVCVCLRKHSSASACLFVCMFVLISEDAHFRRQRLSDFPLLTLLHFSQTKLKIDFCMLTV